MGRAVSQVWRMGARRRESWDKGSSTLGQTRAFRADREMGRQEKQGRSHLRGGLLQGACWIPSQRREDDKNQSPGKGTEKMSPLWSCCICGDMPQPAGSSDLDDQGAIWAGERVCLGVGASVQRETVRRQDQEREPL